jgi:diketogulonate reductase-like aldo/keto reductase
VLLPVIGMGTWITFNVGSNQRLRDARTEVLREFFRDGGGMIDSSPMYGSAEEVVGYGLAQLGGAKTLFSATKVWTVGALAGRRQMERSKALWRLPRLDLMQVHNFLDWEVHLPTLKAWKAEGRFRLLGVTHYTPSAHGELEAVMRAERWDFVQLNYALDDRAVEKRLLPLAEERGIAVLVNQPFGGGGLLRKLLARPLPEWAGELGCTSWAQLLLKFVLAQPAVTCVIPGTGKPEHMRDNVKAGLGAYPDDRLRQRMIETVGV